MQSTESSGFSSRLSRIKNSSKQGQRTLVDHRRLLSSVVAGFLIKVSTAKQAFLLIRMIEESENGCGYSRGDLKDWGSRVRIKGINLLFEVINNDISHSILPIYQLKNLLN